MTARRFAGALLAGGALTLGPTFALPAAATGPGGPTAACRGDEGPATVDKDSVVVGAVVQLRACGFVPGTNVIAYIDGASPVNVLADSDGHIATALRLVRVGVIRLTAIGAEWLPVVTPTPGPTATPTSSPGPSATPTPSAAATPPARLDRHRGVRVEAAAIRLRVVRVSVTVLPPPAPGRRAPAVEACGSAPGADATGGAASGGAPSGTAPGAPGGLAPPAVPCSAARLPFTGAETGALAGLAVVLAGGGVALRVAGRRRRKADVDSP